MVSKRKNKQGPSSPISQNKPSCVSRSRGRVPINPYPTEDEEQIALALWLTSRFGDRWEHVPGQRWAKVQYLVKLRRMGARKGSLDIRIYEPVYDVELSQIFNGVAVEMKRQKGGRETEDQKLFAQMLRDCGWLTLVAYGAQDAIDKIEQVYGKV